MVNIKDSLMEVNNDEWQKLRNGLENLEGTHDFEHGVVVLLKYIMDNMMTGSYDLRGRFELPSVVISPSKMKVTRDETL